MSLSAAELVSLFPPGVVVEVAGPADADPARLHPSERDYTTRMVPSRLAEFASGRNAARRALRSLGCAEAPLLRVPGERHVLWPEGVVGSISHAGGFIVAAVAPLGLDTIEGPLSGLGLDVESAAPLEPGVAAVVSLPEELAALASLSRSPLVPRLSPPDWPKLLFAMKEAAYKAWYPLTRVALGFHDMVLAVAPPNRFSATVHPGEAGVALELERRGLDPLGWRITGTFLGGSSHVAVAAVVTPSN